MSKQEILEILYKVIDLSGLSLEKGEDTSLLGNLDSLGLVSFLLDVELGIAERGLELTIMDERAMSRYHSPFRTLGTLADYILELQRD